MAAGTGAGCAASGLTAEATFAAGGVSAGFAAAGSGVTLAGGAFGCNNNKMTHCHEIKI